MRKGRPGDPNRPTASLRCFLRVDLVASNDNLNVARREADLNPWPAPFDQPFYLLMNVAVGGNFPGVPSPQTRFPAELVVDHVRVYDKVGGYGEPQPIGKGRFPWQADTKRR